MNAIVTGASKGIGAAIALKLAEKGYNLSLIARNREGLETIQQQLSTKGVKVGNYSCDLSFHADIDSTCMRIAEKWDYLDVLVLNAGIFVPGAMLTEPENNLTQQWNVNVLANYRLLRHLTPLLREGKKKQVFFIGSIAGLATRSGAGSYSVSKYALHGMAEAMREELSPSGIKVSLVIPGATLTSSWKGSEIPEDHFVQASDIAAVIGNALDLSAAAVQESIIINPVKPF